MNQLPFKLFIWFFFSLFLFSKNSYSQLASAMPYDSNYINRTPSKYDIRIYTATKQNTFYFFHQKWADRIEFHPAQKIAAGLGFAFKGVGIDLGVAVYRKGFLPDQKTTGFNFIGTLYRGRNIIEAIFEINNGFAESTDSGGQKIDILRNDVAEINFGMNYNYVFNFKKLSLNAAYPGTQIQKKSAGSPLLGAYFSDINVVGTDSLIPHQFSESFNPAAAGTQVNVFSFGITGGYVYTLVLPYSFYLTASLTPGISFSLSQSQRDSLNLFKNTIHLGPKIITREAVGYAGKKVYVIATYAIDINTAGLGNKNFLLYTPEKIKLVFGYRI